MYCKSSAKPKSQDCYVERRKDPTIDSLHSIDASQKMLKPPTSKEATDRDVTNKPTMTGIQPTLVDMSWVKLQIKKGYSDCHQ